MSIVHPGVVSLTDDRRRSIYKGKSFLLSEDGETCAGRAGPERETMHTNPLEEMSLSTPAVAYGSLIVRTQSKLYRIAEGGQP